MSNSRIAVISATPLAMAPAAAAITHALPQVTVWNLLDDRLLPDAQAQGGVTQSLARRMDNLIEHALAGDADGVLLTCSQYGQRAEARAAEHVPVLSADGPLFDEVVRRAPERVLLVASLPSAAEDSTDRLGAALADAGAGTRITPLVVPAAARPLPAGELITVLRQAIDGAAEFDLVVLAQYSLAPAAAELGRRLEVPVLDGPSAAARRLRTRIDGQRP
ncbi:MAG: aspartate/glutamate racemase family protein [Beutenbergiaceae bacterium]